MGYRSDVGFVLSKKAKTALLVANVNLPTDEIEPCDVHELEDGDTGYRFTDIKWYAGFFPFVDQIEAAFNYLDEIDYQDEYVFARIGEEVGDIEQRGYLEGYIEVHQFIDCSFPCT